VGAHVIHDFLERGDPDFRMIAKPVEKLLVGPGRDFEIVATRAVELQYPEALRVSHTLGGMVYKTFTTPQANVKKATYGALNRMQIRVVDTKRNGSTELITAKAADREIEIELEALTPSTTRMLVVAKKDSGILRDSATATEIILQTEKMVGQT